MKELQFVIPILPPSLNTYSRMHWTEQRQTAMAWKRIMVANWHQAGRKQFTKVHVTLCFYFPDRHRRDLDNYIATGSKFTGDALKGFAIPDDSPEYLAGWTFSYRYADIEQTTITIREIV